MRFLKNKIARALQLAELNQSPPQDSKPLESARTRRQSREIETLSPLQEFPLEEAPKVSDEPPQRKRKSIGNNIMKNYCRALVNFGLSSLARPYLLNEAESFGISYAKFIQILNSKRKNINCIKGLRGLLLQERRDSRNTKAFKTMFQRSCEVFLKYFCVNWIFNSKVDNRIKHLNYRYKILRRVRNPEHFTYLEDFGRRAHTH